MKKKGIRLVDRDDDLASEYIKRADETIDVFRSVPKTSLVWLATTKYYCEYLAIYALLMKIGVKCEIHDCTIAVCQLLEAEGTLSEGYTKILEKDKEIRIANQYYLKGLKVDLDYDKVVRFVNNIKEIINGITTDEINRIRKKLL